MSDNITNEKGVFPLAIQEEMKNCYLDYAMSVIVGRALPDVRDGLKPVHRRILYSMYILNNYHARPYVKSARVVGEVIGKFHPHGESSVYSSIVRMAQDFSMRYMIVDGQGNFGSVDGDNAAAMRYTEIRMQRIAEELLKDIDKETVDWQPNYDDSLTEPMVLPTKIPNLLINGSNGIAVGMATNIPPHNLREIMLGLKLLIDNPDAEIIDLMRIIPGPDFPTKGMVYGTSGIKSAYFTGKGIIQLRAKVEVETYGKQDRERLVIYELPYQVNKARLIEKMAYLVNNKEIVGISDIRDESNRLGIRVVVEIKKGENAHVILNRLYKQTQLQMSYGIIFLSLYRGQPKVMNLKEQLVYFIEHRREIVIRRTNYELRKSKEKAHLLEGLKIAVENIDAVVELIKKSKGPKEAKAGLEKHYNLSDKQAQGILEMRLQRLTGLEQDKILKDYKEIMELIDYLESILSSDALVNKIIREEFDEILEKYGDERRTEIVSQVEEIETEDLIKKEEVFVTITHKGYIKRMTLDTFKSQKRGGKGVKSSEVSEDFFTHIFTANTHTRIMFFTDKGTVFSIKVYNIPEGSRTAKGRNIVNLLSIGANEKVKEIVLVPDDLEEKYLLISTIRGNVKKSNLSDYKNVKPSGLKAIKIDEGDSVLGVRITDGKNDVLLSSASGKVIRFSEEDCRSMGRVSKGVKGITVDNSDHLVGMEIVRDDDEILSVTDNGFGKRTLVSEYRRQGRGGKGILAMRVTEKTGKLVQIKAVNDKDDLVLITNKGQVIRIAVKEISRLGRNTQGVRLIRPKPGEALVAVESILDSD